MWDSHKGSQHSSRITPCIIMIYNLNSQIFSLLKLTTSVTHIRCRAVTWKIHEKSALESPKVTRTSLAESKCTSPAYNILCKGHMLFNRKTRRVHSGSKVRTMKKKIRKDWKVRKVEKSNNVPWCSLTFFRKSYVLTCCAKSAFLDFCTLCEKSLYSHSGRFWAASVA